MIIDLLSIAFLLLTAMFCFAWPWPPAGSPFKGKWQSRLFLVLAVLTGLWWLALALCKTLWLIIQGGGG